MIIHRRLPVNHGSPLLPPTTCSKVAGARDGPLAISVPGNIFPVKQRKSKFKTGFPPSIMIYRDAKSTYNENKQLHYFHSSLFLSYLLQSSILVWFGITKGPLKYFRVNKARALLPKMNLYFHLWWIKTYWHCKWMWLRSLRQSPTTQAPAWRLWTFIFYCKDVWSWWHEPCSWHPVLSAFGCILDKDSL